MSCVLRDKRKATCFVYLQSSPYIEDNLSSQLRSCLHDGIFNAAPRIGGNLKNWDCIDSVHLEG